ncbi:MAG: polyprenyl synthetase family protein [Candidatus Aenigmatarchaeota archaeon]
MNVEKILEAKSKMIDREIAAVFPKKGLNNLNDAAWYHLSTGGKRIRPVMGIMVCEALNGDSKKALPFMAACEILHNWLLIHDDIEDGDAVRRNKPTVWKKYGIAHAINVGDYMSQKTFELILRSRKRGVDEKKTLRLMAMMVDTAIKTAEGQAMDINLRNNDRPKERDYMDAVLHKTAYYIALPMIGGAVIAGADEKTINRIDELGKYIGPAFQIIDDLLDLTEGKGRGEIGRDVKEGKRSILVIHCLSKCSKEEEKKLLSILNKQVKETSIDDITYAKILFEKYGSVNYAKRKADWLIKKAKAITAKMPPKLRDTLDLFIDYLVERKK